MIKFALSCAEGHGFEGWFRDNGDFDTQAKRGLVECPACGSSEVSKALMAPAVSTARGREKIALAVSAEQKRIMGELKKLGEKLRENAEDVGDRFAEEARKIHFGETEARGIFGQATMEEAASLHEDGIEFLPIPNFPDERN
ncbi:MAG: DUF1178 family protein [Methylobacterium mesophilicum]|nr:DUF1178 family protein [Methylobacterium mesophilicum]